MIKRGTYKKIVATIDRCKEDDAVEFLTQKFPNVGESTLGSIYAIEIMKKVRKNHHKISNPENPEVMAFYYNKYEKAVQNNAPSGVIIRMARELDFSPAILAKLLLEYYLAHRSSCVSSKNRVNQLLRDPAQIMDKDLAHEVTLCQLKDSVYGPFADSIKHSIGHEYEFLLKEKLKQNGIVYQDEDILRSRGFDKTPDVKLELPIAVNGRVINWIESKASFGDEETHKKNMKEQFWSYWNRFGAGLVIYWFGYIEDLDQYSDKGIMLRDSFPTDIVHMEFD